MVENRGPTEEERRKVREEVRKMTKEEFYAWKAKQYGEIAAMEAQIAKGPTLDDLKADQAASDTKFASRQRQLTDSEQQAQDEEIGEAREMWTEMGEDPAEFEEIISAAGGTPTRARTPVKVKRESESDEILFGSEGDGTKAESGRMQMIFELTKELRDLADDADKAWEDAEMAGPKLDGPAAFKRHREYLQYRMHLHDEYMQEYSRITNGVRPKLPSYQRLAIALRVQEWLNTEISMADGGPDFLEQVARDGGDRNETLARLRDIRVGIEGLRMKLAKLRILISSGIRKGMITGEKRDALVVQLNNDFTERLTELDDTGQYPTTQDQLGWIAEEDAYLEEETQRVAGQIAQFKV